METNACFCIRKDCDCQKCNQIITKGLGKDYIEEIKWPNYETTKARRKTIGYVVYN